MLKGISLSPKIICMPQNCCDVLLQKQWFCSAVCCFTDVFKSLQIRLPRDKYTCQSYLSRFQFSFHISWSTCAARAPYWLRGMWSPDTSWCICSVKRKTLTGMVMEPRYKDCWEYVSNVCPWADMCFCVVLWWEIVRVKMLAFPTSIEGIIIWPLRTKCMQQYAAYGFFLSRKMPWLLCQSSEFSI